MAKMNLKRSIAMLLVLNMLTGMLPIQALAEEGNAEAPTITVTVTPSASSSSSEKKESAPAEKKESAPAEKQESAPAEKKESAPAEKQESAPAEKQESAPAEKQESAPAEEKTESAPAEKTESAPAEKQESAPAEEKTESAPAEEKTESAPAEEKTESAPAEEKTESAPAEEKTESAPTEEKTESAPTEEKTESAPVETVSAEVASYEDDTANDPDPVSENTSFEGVEPELDYDSELTFGEEIDGVVTETTETETDEEGNKTVTETTEVVTKGETEDGAAIEGKETYVESETTNADGEVTGSHWVKDGVEIIDTVVKEETGDGEQPEVTVDLIPGETTESSVVTSETVVENTADGSTVTITETDRTVTAETSDAKVTVNDADTGLVEDKEAVLTGPEPVYDEDDNGAYGSNGVMLDKVNGEHIGKEDVFDRNYLSSQTLDRFTLENGVVIWVNDSNRVITNITVPEGETLPEDFEYEIGSDMTAWYTGVGSNPVKNSSPANSTFENNVKDPESGKKFDQVTLENGVVLWLNDGDKTVANVVVPEGVELPEDFQYGVGTDVKAWYTSVGTNPVAASMPANVTSKLNVSINNINNWYDADGNIIHAPFADAEFCYVGTGEHSKFFNAYVFVTYVKDENGNPVLDENGEPIIESIKTSGGADVKIDGEIATELPDEVTLEPVFDNYSGSRPVIFMLMDKNGNRTYGYCCDLATGTSKGYWYDVSNLEDSDYYASEESEEHIRSIALNGYWGTSDVAKEDGTYEMGSLEKIKQDLRDAIINGQMENTLITLPVLGEDGNAVVDEEGNPVTESKYMMEIIDDLSAGEALLATQSAIWSFANGSIATGAGKDGMVVIDADNYKLNHDPSSKSKDGEGMDDWGSARVDFLYNWLVTLETEEQSTTIINEKNFVEDMSLTVRDKDEAHKNNKDDNKDNDVYNTDLNFKLAFVPGENDDLLVQITYNDLDGNPVNVVRRLAGDNTEDQSYGKIEPDEDGSYVIEGLKLSENEDFAFDLRLEGTQYLENGVYIYQAVGGRENSQTFVGVAEGKRNVDVSIGVTIKFDVDEDNHVVAERRWHSEKDPQRTERETPPPPAEYRLGFGVGQLEVIEEEVPLAAPPQTGDMSILWFAMIALSGCGLCILNLLEKRKCRA